MKAAFRESDILARQGGDEFIILFANTSRHDAATAMETLSHNVARFNQQAANRSWRSPGAASNMIPPAIPVSTRWWPPLTA